MFSIVRKARMLTKIDQVSIEECVSYISRLLRLYVIFTLIALILTILAANDETEDLLVLSVVQVVLYALNVGLLYLFCQNHHTSENSPLLPIFSATLLALFNTIDMIYLIVELSDWFAVFSLFGIISQVFTVLILVKLRGKLINRRRGVGEYAHEGSGDNNIQTPIAEAYVHDLNSVDAASKA